MKPYSILIPIFILALLQGVFLPVNLVLLIIIFWAMVRSEKEAALVAFVSGLFLDLAGGTPMGFSSLLLLLASYFIFLYSRRFDVSHPIFLPVFVFICSGLTGFSRSGLWFKKALILALLAVLLRPLVKYYRQDFDRQTIRLKV